MSRRNPGGAATALVLLSLLSGCGPALVAAGGGLGLNAVREERTTADQVRDVETALTVEARLRARDPERFGEIDVEVFEGRALLIGAAPDEAVVREAVEIARGVAGVREVIEEIELGEGLSLGRSAEDAWISTQLRTRLTADTKIAAVNYTIETYDGVVHLFGLARSPAELRRASEVAASVPGVRQVVSHVLLINDPRRKPPA